jgi:hypothetical protein
LRVLPLSNLRAVFIAATPYVIPSGLRRDPRVVILEKDTREVFERYESYRVWQSPVTIIYYNGRSVVGEEGADPDGTALENELAYAALFSTKEKSS